MIFIYFGIILFIVFGQILLKWRLSILYFIFLDTGKRPKMLTCFRLDFTFVAHLKIILCTVAVILKSIISLLDREWTPKEFQLILFVWSKVFSIVILILGLWRLARESFRFRLKVSFFWFPCERSLRSGL